MRLRLGPAAILLVALGMSVVTNSVACMPRGPVVGGADARTPGVGGTIAGIVRTTAGTPLAGRKVTATDVASGAKFEASTATDGGYTMKVPKGKYRLAVELRADEALEKDPMETEVGTSDLDPHRDFIVTAKDSD